MTARHHGTGKFAAIGPRQPRTEHRNVAKAKRLPNGQPVPSRVNATYNKRALRQGGPARGATPGQVVATIKVS
jgi:hypothetical protein